MDQKNHTILDKSDSHAGKRVFIVEDEMIQALLLEKTIERFGFEIVGMATKGEEAIEKIEELRPDIITVDIQLEDKTDGITVARKIKEFFSPNVIFITGNSDSLNYTRAQEAGFVAFLTKPVQKEKLEKSLNLCLQEVGEELFG